MIFRALLHLTLVLALGLVGFGHKPLAPAQNAQATAYVLAGGSWADICGQAGDPRHDAAAQCQACILTQSCALAASAQVPSVTASLINLSFTAPRVLIRLSQHDWANGARAPPLT